VSWFLVVWGVVWVFVVGVGVVGLAWLVVGGGGCGLGWGGVG